MNSPVLNTIVQRIFLSKKIVTPLYIQLYRQLSVLMQSGDILPDTKLPGSRLLASALKINRQTVISALHELENTGMIYAIAHQGTFVAKNITQYVQKDSFFPLLKEYSQIQIKENRILTPYEHPVIPKDFIIIDDGLPDYNKTTIKQIAQEYSSIAIKSQSTDKLKFNLYNKNIYFETQIKNYLSQLLKLDIQTQNICTTTDIDTARFYICTATLSKGDLVLVAKGNHYKANMQLQYAGANIIQVNIDEYGMLSEEIEQICQKHKIKLLHILPDGHYPTTTVTNKERRKQILALAKKYNFIILEENEDIFFSKNSTIHKSIITEDQGEYCIHLGSFDKLLPIDVSIGYIIGTTPTIQKITEINKLIEKNTKHIQQNILGELLSTDEIKKIEKRAVQLYQNRKKEISKIITSKCKYIHIENNIESSNSLALWLNIPWSINLRKLQKHLWQERIYIPSEFLFQNTTINNIRIGYASLTTAQAEKIIISIERYIQSGKDPLV